MMAASLTDISKIRTFQSVRARKIHILRKPKHYSTFEQPKAQIASPTIRVLPVFDQPFTIHTDASELRTGAAFEEVLQDVEHVVTFASHNFSAADSSLGATQHERMATIFSIRTWRVDSSHSSSTVPQSRGSSKAMNSTPSSISGPYVCWNII